MPNNFINNESISLTDIQAALMLASAAMSTAKAVSSGLIDYSLDKPVITTARSKLLSALHLLQLSTQRADAALYRYQQSSGLTGSIFYPYLKKKQNELSEVNALTLQLKQILLNYSSGNEIPQSELIHLNSKLDEFRSLHA